jgi:hypothetical protein
MSRGCSIRNVLVVEEVVEPSTWPAIGFGMEHSRGAGDRHDRGVAIAMARREAARR